ncbi:hypothetical protein LP109_14650 (plasmid) [Moraxella bovis]|uniref:Uncharacterized protein n=1 Tax=Moraxella bovis TaxID=476 RepID=A0ABY6MBB0_MORBO|nr:hypothetical protein [Moraxella bovis]UYZ77101.1 hypothetical protein LP093_14105 [Moraxella bovis]UYZ79791.1 hypothetical protein LP115_14105 [Moraxella bovis]UYZ88279.1 hypothetical protein LP094_14160 [Moraxella bovis]UYZ91007.1 hypothetical protein LP114_14370 [Moraxella bovis]UYZ99222.1 hypothetical protein LP107_14040 [Moraxella bovis]
MDKRDLRGAYHKADFDYKMSSIFIFEYTVIIPIIVGLFFKSWYAGIWSFLILIVIAPIKIVGLFLAVIFTILWVFIGWSIGYSIDGLHAGILGALIAFVIGFGVHASALAYILDFLSSD